MEKLLLWEFGVISDYTQSLLLALWSEITLGRCLGNIYDARYGFQVESMQSKLLTAVLFQNPNKQLFYICFIVKEIKVYSVIVTRHLVNHARMCPVLYKSRLLHFKVEILPLRFLYIYFCESDRILLLVVFGTSPVFVFRNDPRNQLYTKLSH